MEHMLTVNFEEALYSWALIDIDSQEVLHKDVLPLGQNHFYNQLYCNPLHF